MQEAGAATIALPCSLLNKLKIRTLRLLCVVVVVVGGGLEFNGYRMRWPAAPASREDNTTALYTQKRVKTANIVNLFFPE